MVADPKFVSGPANCWLVSAEFIIPFTGPLTPRKCRCCGMINFPDVLESDLKFFRHYESISFIHFGDQFFALCSNKSNDSSSYIQHNSRMHSIHDDIQVIEDFENEILFCVYREESQGSLWNVISVFDSSGKRNIIKKHVLYLDLKNLKTVQIARKLNEPSFRNKVLKIMDD
jgi:hypothetical protein